MISSMGSDIQYSTEILYPSVSFYSSMGEVASKSAELLQTNRGEGQRTRKAELGADRWTSNIGKVLPALGRGMESGVPSKATNPLTCH